ncbi:hypothetical protein B0H14DRAFT_2623106 [Mycena olivaceomarginata]|nr:hypothetical protein B0H14DRAFT_2623106 [Mycena olivaceomarginata]
MDRRRVRGRPSSVTGPARPVRNGDGTLKLHLLQRWPVPVDFAFADKDGKGKNDVIQIVEVDDESQCVTLRASSQVNGPFCASNVDLGTFFGDAPQGNVPGPATTSAPTTPHRAAPAPTGAAKDFIEGIALSEIPPKDKHFDGKSETRQLQREVHSLTQGTARIHAAFEQFRGETTRLLKGGKMWVGKTSDDEK